MMNEFNLTQINNELKKPAIEKDQYFFGHGKLLLSGEYLVLDGADALAIPTKIGQSLSVKYAPSFSPVLSWRSIDVHGECWFDCKFEFWHFNCLDENPSIEALMLQNILRQARSQNPHFLRDDVDVKVETRLGFPLNFGLGSSSSLTYNIAQWAYVSPFELLFKTQGGSGYDIACAQSDGPILYKKLSSGPNWSPVSFYPSFKDNIYFLYLGSKQNSREAVKLYAEKRPVAHSVITAASALTERMFKATSLIDFQKAMVDHELLVSSILKIEPVKEARFGEFNGAIKSLGAWGGDFVMVATCLEFTEVKKYFSHFGLNILYRYDDLISPPIELDMDTLSKKHLSNNTVH
jgi:mevalonate kinase